MLLYESTDTTRHSRSLPELHRMSRSILTAHVAKGRCPVSASSSKYLHFVRTTLGSLCQFFFTIHCFHPNSDQFNFLAVNQKQTCIFFI